MNLVAHIRFMRKHALSAIQLFLMWRHAHPSGEGSVPPEMADIPESLYAKLPRAPAPNALFSDGEIETLIRITHDLQGAHRLNGWALANRCVWERLAPDHFPDKVAGAILREAYGSDDLANWVGSVMQKDHPHYGAVFDQIAVDVVRATNPYYVDDAQFDAFLDELKAKHDLNMKTKSLDDLDPKSARRLANLLSHDLSFRSSEEGFNCIKNPAKWIKDKLLGDAEVSNLILNDFGCHDDSEFHEKLFGNIEGRFEVFEMSENIHYDEDTYMPRNGRFSAVLDLGQGDAVRIEAWGQDGKTMILRDIKCFDSASYDEVIKATAKERFAIFLGIALALAKNGNAALSAEEMLETLEHVVASEPEILSIKQTREIESALSEPADRPASMIRRSM